MPYKLLLTIVLIFYVASKGNAEILGFGSSKPGSVNYTAASTLSQLLTEYTTLTTRTIPHSGTAATIYSLNVGEVDFAVANLLEVVLAHKGESFYTHGKQENLRLIGTLFQLVTGFMVREGSNIQAISDLRGVRVPGGYTGELIFEHLQQALLANANLAYSDVKLIPVSNGIQAAEQFSSNRLDTFYYSMSSGKVREVDVNVGGLRALPIDTSTEAMNRLRKYMPVAYATQISPESKIPGVHKTMDVMTYDYVILTSLLTEDDAVYELTKVVYEQGVKSGKMVGPLASFKREAMLKESDDIDYHPGAIRFYKEIGIWQPE